MVFATHEVTLHGHSLRRIETAMQRMELACLSGLAGKQRSLVMEGQSVILEITAREANDERKEAEFKR